MGFLEWISPPKVYVAVLCVWCFRCRTDSASCSLSAPSPGAVCSSSPLLTAACYSALEVHPTLLNSSPHLGWLPLTTSTNSVARNVLIYGHLGTYARVSLGDLRTSRSLSQSACEYFSSPCTKRSLFRMIVQVHAPASQHQGFPSHPHHSLVIFGYSDECEILSYCFSLYISGYR